jgi:hypothetical protein
MGGEDWIHLAQDKNLWRALVNTVINLRIQVLSASQDPCFAVFHGSCTHSSCHRKYSNSYIIHGSSFIQRCVLHGAMSLNNLRYITHNERDLSSLEM